MTLDELRNIINEIDDEILNLFLKRMEICEKVSDYKKQNSLPIYQKGREEKVLELISQKTPEDLKQSTDALFRLIMAESKKLQAKKLYPISKNSLKTQKKLTSVIIACGGSSSRMNGIDKLFYELDKKPLILHTISKFLDIPDVFEIILSTSEGNFKKLEKLVKTLGTKIPIKLILGGKTRQESVLNGFNAASEEADLICIHDGARPFIEKETIEMCIENAGVHGASVVCVPTKDTVKLTNGDFIVNTPERSLVFNAQTPQIFKRDVFKKALDFAISENLDFTDDSQLFENFGINPHITLGSYKNIKITTPEDLSLRNGETEMRIGHGYDVHRLVDDRALILGGVNIPCEKGLLGHSDADVLTHAIMDAMLGALALGDIGKLFPDNDMKYSGADSIELLKEVNRVIKEKGYAVSNLDSTIVAQAPKLAPFILEMREKIASAIETDIDHVSIKATTEEHLGFTGEGLGISATAVCILKKL